MIKELVKKIRIYGIKRSMGYAANELVRMTYWGYIRRSYSQCAEDLFIDRLVGFKKNGFYVDVGAHDPDRFSNTKKFYRQGWNGINIEPDYKNFRKFQKKRRRDINLNIGIGAKSSVQTFFRFIPDTLSTFSNENARKYCAQGYIKIGEIDVEIKRLAEIFEEYVKNKHIDLLNIDVEGFEMQVLKSNDWEKFKPTSICIESVKHSKEGIGESIVNEQLAYLHNLGYELVYFNGINSIFVVHDQLCKNR